MLIAGYKYSEEQVIVDYPVLLKDGSTFNANLVLTKDPSVPHVIVFVTSDAIPVEQVKMILSQSSLQYGAVFQIKGDAYAEFWGIEKKTNIFTGKLEFENILDYPKPFKCSNNVSGASSPTGAISTDWGSALDSLVSSGTITQGQETSIETAINTEAQSKASATSTSSIPTASTSNLINLLI